MGAPNSLVSVALIAFIPASAACFTFLEPRRAMLASLLGGWLLLPSFDLFGMGVPLFHTKGSFVPGVVLATSLLLDGRRWRRLRPHLVDLPVAVLCLAPSAASLTNDLGAYDALSAGLRSVATWGAPYALGRAYLRVPGSLTELAAALAAAALAYVPPCLWEIRMSPQLHAMVYGFYPFGSDFTQVVRFGGYRPSVFMADGLMTSMFVAAGTLAAYGLWRSRARRTVLGIGLGWAVVVLATTSVLCKSTGSIVLLGAGLCVLEGSRLLRTSALVLGLAAQ
jgi:hypothetical protein